MKINHLLGQGWKSTTGIFLNFCVALPANICGCSNEYDVPIALCFHVTCIDQLNFVFFFQPNYKFSQHIPAKAPNKELTCIHIETMQLVKLDFLAQSETFSYKQGNINR